MKIVDFDLDNLSRSEYIDLLNCLIYYFGCIFSEDITDILICDCGRLVDC